MFVAAFDLEIMDVRRVTERCQLLGDPEGPGAVGGGVADEDVGQRSQDLAAVRQVRDEL
jgi:hypothetical protein